MVHDQNSTLESDRQWMTQYGCDPIIEEHQNPTNLRPRWRELLKKFDKGDELVIPKLSTVVSTSSDLAYFLDHCRVERVRIIAFRDKIDSNDELFPSMGTKALFDIIAGIPDEIAAIRNNEKHTATLRRIRKYKPGTIVDKRKRDKTIVNLYLAGTPVDEIWKASGFRSRSSVFRVLRSNNIQFNRGHSPEQLAEKQSKSE